MPTYAVVMTRHATSYPLRIHAASYKDLQAHLERIQCKLHIHESDRLHQTVQRMEAQTSTYDYQIIEPIEGPADYTLAEDFDALCVIAHDKAKPAWSSKVLSIFGLLLIDQANALLARAWHVLRGQSPTEQRPFLPQVLTQPKKDGVIKGVDTY